MELALRWLLDKPFISVFWVEYDSSKIYISKHIKNLQFSALKNITKLDSLKVRNKI